MHVERSSAITIIAGAVLFLAAAFSPISRVFGTRDPAQKLEIIAAAPTQWLVAQVLFGLGAIVTAAGVAMLASRIGAPAPSMQLRTSAALMAVGALFWGWHLYLRTVDPAAFAAGEIPLWLFATYSLLTIVGLALVGLALLATPLPGWVGWLCIGSAAAFLLLALVFGDMPPFVYYAVLLAVGITIYRAAAGSTAAATVATG